MDRHEWHLLNLRHGEEPQALLQSSENHIRPRNLKVALRADVMESMNSQFTRTVSMRMKAESPSRGLNEYQAN